MGYIWAMIIIISFLTDDDRAKNQTYIKSIAKRFK